ncbi:MAG: hypothetical protein JWN95_3740 [Frankiales bacterium]|nr:hypothetical protein [Frankiales bacterium]
MSSYVDFAVLRNVVIVALVAGVGITAVFSVAARALSAAQEGTRPATGQRVLAGACLAVAAAVVAVGLWAVLAK